MKILKNKELGRGILIESDGYIDRTIYDNKKIIKETLENSNSFLETPIVYALLTRADVKNRNGRIYSKSEWIREIEKYKGLIELGMSIGENNHPNSTNIDLNNVGIHILDVWWKENVLYGKIKIPVSKGYIKSGICSTSADRIANLMSHDIRISCSSRGVGEVYKKHGDIYVKDFNLLCWDTVHTPSVQEAILDKNKKFVYSKHNIKEENIIQKNNSKMNNIKNFLKKYK